MLSGLEPLIVTENTNFINVGERTNVTGSLRFARMIKEEKYDDILAGVTTEVCVQTSMREANDRGFECLLAEDATESYFPEFKQATLKMIRAQGAIVGWTAKVSEIAEALNE